MQDRVSYERPIIQFRDGPRKTNPSPRLFLSSQEAARSSLARRSVPSKPPLPFKQPVLPHQFFGKDLCFVKVHYGVLPKRPRDTSGKPVSKITRRGTPPRISSSASFPSLIRSNRSRSLRTS